MSVKISVVICTYNPRMDYLERVLEGLSKQSLPIRQWELVIIDNASTEPLLEKIDISWHPNSRVIQEPEPGLTAARLRGGDESSGEILIFVDDDNVLDADFLETAIAIGNQMPQLGTWGGTSRGVYESPPPPWFKSQEGWIGVRYFESESWSNDPLHASSTPIGAGMAVRRHVLEKYSENLKNDTSRKVLDRAGDSLMSGGDLDIVYTGCANGYGKGVFPQLSLDHLIPPERTTQPYLEKLIEMIACSQVLLRDFHGLPQPRSAAKGKIGLIRFAYIHLIRNQANAFARARERGLIKGEALLGKLSTQQKHPSNS